ncbi:MAG: hypothetical protein RL481_757 [Pseudomonadota bacterium]|jgi:uncharacterized repeat protein (TIGR01451 family)
MKKLIKLGFSTLLLAASSLPAMAAAPVELSSDIFVEKQQKRPDGSLATTLVAPKTILPGDQLVFVVRYRNAGKAPASGLTVTNPIPAAISFSGTSDGAEWVSIDGGKSWGKLSQMSVKAADGNSRPALMTDVTHLKWNMNQTLAAGESGKLIFRGVVK